MDYSLLMGVQTAQYDVMAADPCAVGRHHFNSQPRVTTENFSETETLLHSSYNFPGEKEEEDFMRVRVEGKVDVVIDALLTQETYNGPSELDAATFPIDEQWRLGRTDRDSLASSRRQPVNFSLPSSSTSPSPTTPSSGPVSVLQLHSPESKTGALSDAMCSASHGAYGGHRVRAVVAPGVYYFGIIDILQSWSLKKRIERFLKVYVKQKPARGISCAPPEEYKQRFQKKISEIIEHAIFAREITGSWKGDRHKGAPVNLMTSPK